MRLNDLNGSTSVAETDIGGSYQSSKDQRGESHFLIKNFLIILPVTLLFSVLLGCYEINVIF